MDTHTELFKPDYIVTPGEILEETLEARGIKKKEFSDRCGKTAKTISEIIAGKAPITPETALQFERVLGISARLWSNLESRYRLKLAEKEEQENLEKHIDVSKKFPVNDLIKFGFIRRASSPVERLSSLLEFFGVGSVDTLDYWQDVQNAYYRNSNSFKSDRFAVAAWLRCGQIEAEKIITKPYNQDRFKDALVKVRALTRESDIKVAVAKTITLCAEAGVAVVFVPELKGTKLSGAARWLTKDKALIQLSLRHKSDDHLWFTFFHEAGHIILHGKKELFIDEVDQDIDVHESEADSFAENALISKEDWKEFIMTYSDFTRGIIQEFSDQQGISPGIVLGRLQYQELIPFASVLNSLKVRYEWKLEQSEIV